jgi:signal transduction histidine kinase
VFLSVLVARLLVRPVKRLERAAARIGQGDLEAPVVVPSRDEIGLVAETLEAMRGQLRSRDERMQMMLAGIAHEVRNPLGGIELYAGLLRDELGAPADADKLAHLRKIEREVHRLSTIVSEFLEYARRPKPELKPEDLAGLLTEVRELTLAKAQPLGVEVGLAVEPTRAACDSGQLRRALLNLTENAVQACPPGGRVTLGCVRRGAEVRITVHDAGAGIAADVLAKIWTPFYTTKQKGTGLGLAFVREIVRDHGGSVEVSSASGQGTTFTLTLPAVVE